MKFKGHKITFEVSQQIRNLHGTLPQVPRFNPDGRVMTAPRQKIMTGSELLAEIDDIDQRKGIDPKGNYIRKSREVQFMNHEIGLTEAYRKGGQEAMELYVASVEMLAQQIQAAHDAQKKQSEKPVAVDEVQEAVSSEANPEDTADIAP